MIRSSNGLANSSSLGIFKGFNPKKDPSFLQLTHINSKSVLALYNFNSVFGKHKLFIDMSLTK